MINNKILRKKLLMKLHHRINNNVKLLLIFKEFKRSTKNLFLGAFFITVFMFPLPNKNVLAQGNIPQLDLNETKKRSTFGINENNRSRIDTLKKTTGKVNFKMKKDPWKAVLYSALLPGAGQFYNHSYWKIPVIVGLGGYFVYGWIDNNNQYQDYKQQYANSQTATNPFGNQQLLNLRNFYQDQRDNFIIYSSILYLVNLIDAYVDAQLFDFDVSENVNFGILQREKLVKLSYGF
jgi:hypothetical protein